jgi:condensin complex subunit 3
LLFVLSHLTLADGWQDLAVDNLSLFLHCFSRGHEAIRVEVLHILSDIFMTHGMTILTPETIKPETVSTIWQKALKDADEPEVAAAAAESLAKLMLANVITDEEILKVLVETYFNPANGTNDPLKQALSYFFPVYCHSVAENQANMAKVMPLPSFFLVL